MAACVVDQSISEGHPSREASGLATLVLSFLVGYAECPALEISGEPCCGSVGTASRVSHSFLLLMRKWGLERKATFLGFLEADLEPRSFGCWLKTLSTNQSWIPVRL